MSGLSVGVSNFTDSRNGRLANREPVSYCYHLQNSIFDFERSMIPKKVLLWNCHPANYGFVASMQERYKTPPVAGDVSRPSRRRTRGAQCPCGRSFRHEATYLARCLLSVKSTKRLRVKITITNFGFTY